MKESYVSDVLAGVNDEWDKKEGEQPENERARPMSAGENQPDHDKGRCEYIRCAFREACEPEGC